MKVYQQITLAIDKCIFRVFCPTDVVSGTDAFIRGEFSIESDQNVSTEEIEKALQYLQPMLDGFFIENKKSKIGGESTKTKVGGPKAAKKKIG